MTRDEVLTEYRSIRAAIQRVLAQAPKVCTAADWKRAARALGFEDVGSITVGSEREIEMLGDVALFEPNQRGKRAYDSFLKTQADQLEPEDRDVAQRMSNAFFSIFEVTGRHDIAGVWLKDLLINSAPIWLMDESMEASAPDGIMVGMRLFDAGSFYAGFGIVVPVDAELVHLTKMSPVTPGQRPFGRRLVPMVYGDEIHKEEVVAMVEEMLGSGSLPGLSDLLDPLSATDEERSRRPATGKRGQKHRKPGQAE
jgi:hypothetical protein